MMTEQDALLVLNAVPGLGSVKAKGLMEYFGNALMVLKQPYEDIVGTGIITPHVSENLVHFSKDIFLTDEYNHLHQKNVSVLTAADEAFPQCLRQIPGGPLVLYIKGEAKILHSASIAMVGSRVCTNYGLSMAEKFAGSFAQAGMVVSSGMARGIDTAAHQGCLNAGGQTIAVLGCGLNFVYPKENQQLMARISATGLVVSEMPMNTPPIPANFPRRNRIISGLSLVTVVIEAGEKSGALITAGYAAEQGRDIFALPANIDYTSAKGSNLLLKDGAKIALDPQDVLEEVRTQINFEWPEFNQDAVNQDKIVISDEEMKYYGLLTSEPLHIDELVLKVKNANGNTMETLLNLELKGAIRKLPGGYFVKV